MLPSGINENQIKKINNDRREGLKQLFSGRIKVNFMIQMLNKILDELQFDVFKYFDMSLTPESLITGPSDKGFDYEICKMIIGCHKSNTISMNDSERSSLQVDSSYMNKLKDQVIIHIKIRKYSSYFFRVEQLIPGDEFMYFPVLYKLFSISTYATSLMLTKEVKWKNYIFANIFNKALAAMTLLENNFMDSTYPLVRGVIELYVKDLIINDVDRYNEYAKFINYGIEKTAQDTYPDEFLKKYENRKNKKMKNQSQYLHYGWVDCVEDYNDVVKDRPYCTDGLFDYIINQFDDDLKDKYELLRTIYKRCHEFSHGNIGNHGWPLMHYFDLTIALYMPVVTTYIELCNYLKIDTKIDGIDIISLIYADFELLLNQFNARHEKGFFERYYNVKK